LLEDYRRFTLLKKKIVFPCLIVFGVLIVCFIAGWIFMFGFDSNKEAENNSGNEHIGMYVDGTTLRMQDGSAFVMRGINHSHCWYKEEDLTAFDAISDTGANCIRIVLANGVQWDKDEADEVRKLIEMAKERNMVAIVEVHDGTGDDSIETFRSITNYWVDIADVLKGTEGYCILNIANEWVGSWNSTIWRDGYTEAIPKLREAGIKNVIMVDAAGWGQYGRSIRVNGLEVFESDPDRNTMFSVHMYGLSGKNELTIKYNLEGATNQNLCVCVGEFGYKHSDGEVDEDYIMQYCEEKGIGTLAWSWKGNSGGVEYLDMSNDWEGKDLSTEWGEKVIFGEYGIKNTSKKVIIN